MIDRDKVKAEFAAYTDNYNSSDEKIKLKITHTYRVAAICDRIARSLGMSDYDIELAWLAGMLHDIGRFEQIKNYGTFSDADSIDHAHYGVEILFDGGKISDFVDKDDEIIYKCSEGSSLTDIEIIKTAIWNHSAYRLEEGLDERTTLFCNILRDADKVDIFKVNCDTPIEEIYNVTTDELKNSEITPEVIQAFNEKHAVLRKLKKTAVDNIVGHGALTFELVYPESYRIAQEQGYLWEMMSFVSENENTNRQLANMRELLKNYMDEQINKK